MGLTKLFLEVEVLLLGGRLDRSSVLVVKGIVQKEHVAHFETDRRELPTQLLERMRTQPACDDRTQVLGTKLDFDGPARVQRERDVANRAQVMAYRATLAVSARNQRFPFADGKRFQTVRAERLAGNAIPESRIVAASATRDFWGHTVGRG